MLKLYDFFLVHALNPEKSRFGACTKFECEKSYF